MIHYNPLPCDEPCPKSSGTYRFHQQTDFFGIFLMDHPAACITSTRLKLLALDGTLHLEQIKVTRTHGRIVGKICQSFPLPPSLRSFTGLATRQCALSCSTSGGAHVMNCRFFCFTVRCRWFSRNLTQYFALGACGGVVVKALRYKLAGCGFDSRWCPWNFSVT